MNSFIETLNQFGGQFLNFAWPMLWQSSLLITFVFAVDFLLARRIRASVRYALWLAVLVKLLLPPTLALPTSAAWWLVQTKPAVKAPIVRNYTVSYDTAPQMDFVPSTIPLPPPAPPKLNGAGWMLLLSGTVSAALLLWLAFRWWQVMRMVRRAVVSEKFADALETVRHLARLHSRTRLKLVENRMSPAVCGLFRPVILLPRMLAEQLSTAQLRAVLLHEMFHLRRLDVWVNCAQALLQIVYWWHPLLWIANARIRRVREEAVDDAVMLALRDEADSYAPTLLEVAKLAFRRPLMSLGLVGIMESRSALGQRIERLVDFRAPRKAGLTFASLCGIFVFSAVALPMGEGPAPVEKSSLPGAVIPPPTASIQKTNAEIVLITASFYQTRADDFERMASALKFNQGEANGDSWWSASPDEFRQLTNNLELSGLKAMARPRVLTHSGSLVDFYVGNGTSGTEIHYEPFVVNGLVDLAIRGKVVDAPAGTAIITKVAFTNQFSAKATAENHGGIMIRTQNASGAVESNLVVVVGVQIVTNAPPEGSIQRQVQVLQTRQSKRTHAIGAVTKRSDILKRLHGIRLENVTYDAVPLRAALADLNDEIGEHDPEKLGINFIEPEDVSLATITIKPALTNILVQDVLDAITLTASRPIKYSIQDGGVEFSWNDQQSLNLYSRHFKVETNTFIVALRGVVALGATSGVQTTNVSQMAGSFLSTLGVNLESPGKSIFYNERLGELFVRATLSDFNTIENAIGVLNHVSPQIHIKARFVEVPEAFFSGTAKNSLPAGVTNDAGVLTATEAKKFLRQLESQKDSKILAEPEVIIISGHQAKMVTTLVQTLVTNYVFKENLTNSAIQFQAGQLETGPVFDVTAKVMSDGRTIDMQTIASVTTFYGYATPPTNMSARSFTNSADETGVLPIVLPVVQEKHEVAHKALLDGQTLVLFPKDGEPVIFNPDEEMNKTLQSHIWNSEKKNGKKTLVVLVTAEIVDQDGIRVHPDESNLRDFSDAPFGW